MKYIYIYLNIIFTVYKQQQHICMYVQSYSFGAGVFLSEGFLDPRFEVLADTGGNDEVLLLLSTALFLLD